MRRLKKIMALVLAMAMTMAMSGNVLAAEAKDLDDGYLIINGNQVVRCKVDLFQIINI